MRSMQESASQGTEGGDTVSVQSPIQGTDMQRVTMQVDSFVLTECREGTCQHKAVRGRGWVGGWEWWGFFRRVMDKLILEECVGFGV